MVPNHHNQAAAVSEESHPQYAGQIGYHRAESQFKRAEQAEALLSVLAEWMPQSHSDCSVITLTNSAITRSSSTWSGLIQIE